MPAEITVQTLAGQSLVEYIIAGGPPLSAIVPVGIQNTRVVITPSQYRAAHTVPIQLIPAPVTAGKMIVPISCVIQLQFNTTAYTAHVHGCTIGFGSSAADVIANGWMMFSDNDAVKTAYQSPYNAMDVVNVTGSGQAAGAFNPATHIINQPLYWANNDDTSSDVGDSNIILNIQWVEIDSNTGNIVNGTGNCIYGSYTELDSSDLATTTPITIISAPGANRMIVPLSMVAWNHGGIFDDSVQMQTPPVGILANQAPPETGNNIPWPDPSLIINQPFTFVGPLPATNVGWGSTISGIPNNVADTSILTPDTYVGETGLSLYIQYVIIDVTTGALIPAGATGGDLAPTYTTATTNQMVNALTTPIQLEAAAGANTIQIPLTYVMISKYHTTAFPVEAPSFQFPLPIIGSVPANLLAYQTYMAPNFLKPPNCLFTATHDQIDLGMPEQGPLFESILSADIINQPISWGDVANYSAGSADSTGIAMIQYITISTTTGNILSQFNGKSGVA